jgi:hypothetical protein
VVDEAGVLDPTAKAALEQKLADFEAKTTGQLVVVTLKSPQGTSIEDYGYQLGRHWQIGQKGKNSGAILSCGTGPHASEQTIYPGEVTGWSAETLDEADLDWIVRITRPWFHERQRNRRAPNRKDSSMVLSSTGCSRIIRTYRARGDAPNAEIRWQIGALSQQPYPSAGENTQSPRSNCRARGAAGEARRCSGGHPSEPKLSDLSVAEPQREDRKGKIR